MIGILTNIMAVVLGGILGTVFGKRMSARFTAELKKVFGVCSMGTGIFSISLMENMPAVVLSVALGTALGLGSHLGEWISRSGALLEKPVSRLLGDHSADSGTAPGRIHVAAGHGNGAVLHQWNRYLRLSGCKHDRQCLGFL